MSNGAAWRSLDSGCGLRLAAAVALVAVLLLQAGEGRAQSLRGFVTDAENGAPLELVHVVLSSADAAAKGAVTDVDGSYLVAGLEPGRYVLRASRVGYNTFADTLDLELADSRALNIELQPGFALQEVVVESEGARTTAGFRSVRPRDIARIPTPDLTGDLAAYLATMPGVVALGDQGGQLFIRGGEPAQNLVQIDGVLIYQPMHILGFYSAFPSGIISRSDIHAGGFGSSFGERISSVIDVTARTGSSRVYAGSATLSPFISSVQMEGPILRDRVSVLASVRQSLVERGASHIIGRELPFNFGDAFFKLAGNTTESSRASLIALRTFDRGTLHEGPDPDEVRWGNLATGLRYLVLPRKFPLSADIRASWSRLATELGPRADHLRESRIASRHLSAEATFYGDRTDVDAGIALRVVSTSSRLDGLYQRIDVDSERAQHVAAFVEPQFRIGSGLRLSAGVRVQFFDMRFAPFLEPRWRFEWETGRHLFSAAAGIYYQSVLGLYDRRDAASVFTAWTSAPRKRLGSDDIRAGRAQRAIHALAGYRLGLLAGLQLAAEAYAKRLDNLYIAEWTAYPRFTTRLQPADGLVRGIDLRLEMRMGSLFGQVGYGYAATRYSARQASLRLWYGMEELAFNPPHDRRHQVNAVFGATVLGFELGARLAFGSGLPFSRAVGFDGFALVDDVTSIAERPGFRRVIYERPYDARLPTYHRLDMSVARTFEAAAAEITVQASVLNVYDRRNLFYLDVFTLQRADQLPFLPSLSLKAAF